eukprot:4123789-Amphidinium_carterae.1
MCHLTLPSVNPTLHMCRAPGSLHGGAPAGSNDAAWSVPFHVRSCWTVSQNWESARSDAPGAHSTVLLERTQQCPQQCQGDGLSWHEVSVGQDCRLLLPTRCQEH